MARKIKHITGQCGIDRREIGYYSTPIEVAHYIARRLKEINPNGTSLIDPCVGKEELIKPFINKNLSIMSIDIIDYGNKKDIEYIKGDFINYYKIFKNSDVFNFQTINFDKFDYWVVNPPYNCHEVDYIKDNKITLKSLFSDVGVHNMYSMFISAIIDMAKEGAIVGLIILDSFLTSKAHKKLRVKILENCIIHDILLCPTDLFLDQNADVRTCILIFEKIKRKKKYLNKIRLLNRPLNKNNFFEALRRNNFKKSILSEVILDYEVDNKELIIGVPNEIKKLFKNKRLGEFYKCITGISTGNDAKYISHKKINGFTVPFYKNPASRKFYCEPDGFLIDNFLDEAKIVNNFMVRNITLLFKSGITCSSMGVEFSACYLPPNSTFGVNPNIICNTSDVWWLLAYLNSNISKYIVRGVLIRTNMVTSGYISRLPIPNFSTRERLELSNMSINAYKASQNKLEYLNDYIFQINNIIYRNLKLSNESIDLIEDFCVNIVKKT